MAQAKRVIIIVGCEKTIGEELTDYSQPDCVLKSPGLIGIGEQNVPENFICQFVLVTLSEEEGVL